MNIDTRLNQMNRYQKELAMNLAQLLPEDPTILNDVIIEYVELLGESNRMHDMHEFTSREIESDLGRGWVLQSVNTSWLSTRSTLY